MRALVDLANRQHGVVSHEQLIGLGIHDEAIRHRLAAGSLDRLHHGVYAVGHRRLAGSGRRLAAAMSMNAGGAMVAHYSSGHHHSLTTRKPSHGLIEVAVPSYRGGNRTDVRVLRLGSLTDKDRVVVDGVPCTSVPRTLVDLAGVLSEHDLGKAIREAAFRGMLDLPTIAGVIAGVSRPRGVVQLRELLGHEPARHCDSLLERRVLQLILDAGLPHPVLQQRFVIGSPAETIYADFCWPELQLVVEADGPHHELPSFQARDAYRDAELSAQGALVHRVPQRALDADARAVAATLVAVYNSRAGA
ncbi:MAG: type IV toxin-antitoxin system AbiEi family antitoxin domain-containing protein [Baekduia sp.]